MDLSISAVLANSATANFASLTAGHSIQLQYGHRADFKLGVAPIITLTAENPASLALQGLNQDATYYVRAREYLIATGAELDWSQTVAFRTPLSVAPDTSPAANTHDPAMVVLPATVLRWYASDAIDGFPVDNLGLDAPVAWRAEGSPFAFTAEIGPEEIDTIALLMSNASEAATITIQADDTLVGAQGMAPAFALGPVPFRASANISGRPGYHALVRLPAPETYPFWHVKITDTLTNDTLHLEHAIFGLNRASKRHAVDRTESPVDLGAVSRSRSGVPLRSLGLRLRKAEFEIAAMTEEQFELLYAPISARIGLTEPLLVVPNPKAGAFLHDRILYGTLTGSTSTNLRAHLFTRRIVMESII